MNWNDTTASRQFKKVGRIFTPLGKEGKSLQGGGRQRKGRTCNLESKAAKFRQVGWWE
jgi:hypothetical protein